VFNNGGFDDDPAVEIAEHPFGTSLGAIDRDDAEVFRSDLSYPILNLSMWFANKAISGNLGKTLFRNCGHL